MVNEVFIEAKDAFLKALGPRERRLFQACTSEKLIEDIKQSEVFRPLGSTVQSLVDRISRLESGLSPYFAVVNLFVQSNPETASIVWGGIRLVLQVSRVNFQSLTSLTSVSLSS
jgi:predicted KAP-like P-loop ATPase